MAFGSVRTGLIVLSLAVLAAVIVGRCVQAHLWASIGVLVFLLMTQIARLIDDQARLKARIARHPDLPKSQL